MAAAASQSRGVAILTGANGIFGRWIAKGLAENKYETVLVVRDKAKGAALVEKIEKDVPGAKVRYALVDCSSHSSIKSFADQWSSGRNVEILINNAVIVPSERKVTEAGIEMQWATNVLAYHWLTKEFQRFYAPNARVVFVASRYAGDLDLNDPEFKKRQYQPNNAYRAAKQSNRMLAAAWAEKFAQSEDNKNVVVTSCHPAVANSACLFGLGFNMDSSEKAQIEGSVTPLYCALTEGSKLKSGGWYVESRQQNCEFTSKKNPDIEKLWNLVESYP